MAEVLELAHLVDDHRVAQVQVRRGGIEPDLHAQRSVEPETLLELLRLGDFVRAAGDQAERFVDIRHLRFRQPIPHFMFLRRPAPPRRLPGGPAGTTHSRQV